MAWFKVDDRLHDHPKARKAQLEAMGLWTVAGSYSGDYRLDGFIPPEYVETWRNGPKLAAKLVQSGLWHLLPYNGPCDCIQPTVPHNDGGWCFHEWDERNPTAEEVEEDRQATKARQRRFRAKRRQEPLIDA